MEPIFLLEKKNNSIFITNNRRYFTDSYIRQATLAFRETFDDLLDCIDIILTHLYIQSTETCLIFGFDYDYDGGDGGRVFFELSSSFEMNDLVNSFEHDLNCRLYNKSKGEPQEIAFQSQEAAENCYRIFDFIKSIFKDIDLQLTETFMSKHSLHFLNESISNRIGKCLAKHSKDLPPDDQYKFLCTDESGQHETIVSLSYLCSISEIIKTFHKNSHNGVKPRNFHDFGKDMSPQCLKKVFKILIFDLDLQDVALLEPKITVGEYLVILEYFTANNIEVFYPKLYCLMFYLNIKSEEDIVSLIERHFPDETCKFIVEYLVLMGKGEIIRKKSSLLPSSSKNYIISELWNS